MRKRSDAEQADIAVARAAAGARGNILVRAFGRASEIADQPPLITLCAAMFAAGLVTGNRPLARAGGRMLAAELPATKFKSLIKHRVDRTRPHVLADGGRYRAERGHDRDPALSSFPSGHVAGAVAVARAFAREYPSGALRPMPGRRESAQSRFRAPNIIPATSQPARSSGCWLSRSCIYPNAWCNAASAILRRAKVASARTNRSHCVRHIRRTRRHWRGRSRDLRRGTAEAGSKRMSPPSRRQASRYPLSRAGDPRDEGGMPRTPTVDRSRDLVHMLVRI